MRLSLSIGKTIMSSALLLNLVCLAISLEEDSSVEDLDDAAEKFALSVNFVGDNTVKLPNDIMDRLRNQANREDNQYAITFINKYGDDFDKTTMYDLCFIVDEWRAMHPSFSFIELPKPAFEVMLDLTRNVCVFYHEIPEVMVQHWVKFFRKAITMTLYYYYSLIPLPALTQIKSYIQQVLADQLAFDDQAMQALIEKFDAGEFDAYQVTRLEENTISGASVPLEFTLQLFCQSKKKEEITTAGQAISTYNRAQKLKVHQKISSQWQTYEHGTTICQKLHQVKQIVIRFHDVDIREQIDKEMFMDGDTMPTENVQNELDNLGFRFNDLTDPVFMKFADLNGLK